MKNGKIYGIINFSCYVKFTKRRWIFILKKELKKQCVYYGKKALRLSLVFAILIVMAIAIVLIKYKPAYKVTIDGEEVGYVEDVKKFEEKFENEISSKDYVAFYEIKKMPEYEFTFVEKNKELNEEEILNLVADNTEITYLAYAITVDGKEEAYVETIDEAEQLVAELSEKYEDNEADLDVNIGVQDIYTQDIEDYTIEDTDDAMEDVDNIVNDMIEQEYENKKHTVNGILIAQKPVTSPTITSRFGARWGTTHCGLDLAAPMGTPIYAAADGTVEKVVNSNSGYGNLVVISHGNGIQTYYAHCSKLLVSVGDKVEAGDLIAKVGSTGDSTGPHCHFEIRINGRPVDPGQYIYN